MQASIFRAPLAAILLLLGIVLPAAGAEDPAGEQAIVPQNPALAELLREAGQANPTIEQMRARVEAAEAEISQAGAWMDPMLSVGAMNLPATNPTDLNQEPMTGLWVNASQSFPLTGKYGTKEDAAAAMADATRGRLVLQAANVRETVRNAWYDWAFLRESVATVDTTIRLIDELQSVTRSKYETGKGLQSDLLRLQTERSRLASQRIELEQRARNAGRRVAILLGRSPSELPSAPDELPVVFPILDEADLQRALDHSPRMAVARDMLRANDLKVTLAKQLWWPEVKIGGGYGYRPDADNGVGRADFITLTAGITLPVFGGAKQSKAVQEAHANRRAAESSLRETSLAVHERLSSLLDEDARHETQITLYDQGVLPQAGAALSSVLSDYSVARVDVEALVSSERELVNARLQRLMHLRDRAKVRSAIASLVFESDPSLIEEK